MQNETSATATTETPQNTITTPSGITATVEHPRKRKELTPEQKAERRKYQKERYWRLKREGKAPKAGRTPPTTEQRRRWGRTYRTKKKLEQQEALQSEAPAIPMTQPATASRDSIAIQIGNHSMTISGDFICPCCGTPNAVAKIYRDMSSQLNPSK